MKINTRKIALLTISIATTLFTYRPIFQGKLLGDPFDSRLMLILHEHWWRWFNGLVAFRDTEFFYPYKTALGYSDVFFVQGIIYSFFRLIGFELSNSWTITTFLLLIVGNLGWILIALKYFKNFLIQILFILTISTSLTFVLYFSINPNIVGYSFLSWIFLFYNNIISEKNSYKKQVKIEIFVILFIIYALSCWYGAFFVIVTLIVKVILDIAKIKLNRTKINWKNINKINYRLLCYFLPFQLFFVWLFYFVYIEVGDEPSRPVEEMMTKSPRLELLPNGANLNGLYLSGSLFKPIYILLNFDKEFESAIGIGIVAFICIFFLLINYIFRDYKFFIRNSIPTSILISYLYFVNVNNFSIHKIFFDLIPGFNSIRSPSRYVIIVGFFVIFGIYYFFDNIYSKTKKIPVKIAILGIFLILLLDQYRSPFIGWDKSRLINTDLISKKDEILTKCDYFFYDKPGGWWYDQIEAMTFAIQIGIPTVNGYSGAFPPDYPVEPFDSMAQPNKIFDWIGEIDKNKKGCFVSGSSPLKFLNRDEFSIDFVGFKSKNIQQKFESQFSISPNPYLYIVDYSGDELEISFDLFPSNCTEKQDIRINLNGQVDLFQGEIPKSGQNFLFELNFEHEIVKKLDIITNYAGCRHNENTENEFFYIQNFKYS